MNRPDDEPDTERAWREIVDNYGERASLSPTSEAPRDPGPEAPAFSLERAIDDVGPEPVEARFTPPPAPPVPRPRTWQRAVAWAGLVAAPLLGLVLGLLGLGLPRVVGVALIAWAVGGFVYLVASMPREPRDPWDDGSRV